jgi:hypothetical protein
MRVQCTSMAQIKLHSIYNNTSELFVLQKDILPLDEVFNIVFNNLIKINQIRINIRDKIMRIVCRHHHGMNPRKVQPVAGQREGALISSCMIAVLLPAHFRMVLIQHPVVMFAFQLCDFLTGDTALHAGNNVTAYRWDWCFAFNAKHGKRPALCTGCVDVALAFLFNALLYEVH